jgi:hypothetical protein
MFRDRATEMSLSRNACLLSRCYQKQNQRQVDRLFDVLAKEQNDIDTKYLQMLHSVVERLATVIDVPSAKRLKRVGCRALFAADAMAGVGEDRHRQALSAYFEMLEEVNRGIAGRVSRLGGNLDSEADRQAELKVADAIERYLIVKQVVGKLRSLGEAVTISTPADTTTKLAAAEIIKAELEPIVKAHDALKKRYERIEKLITKGIVVTASSGACPDDVLLFNVANRVRAALSECSNPKLQQAAQAAANSDLSGTAFQTAIEVAMVKTMGARAQDLKIAVVSAVRALDSSSFRKRGDGGRVGNRASRKLDAGKSNRKAWKCAAIARDKYELARLALVETLGETVDARLKVPAPTAKVLVDDHPQSLETLYDERLDCLEVDAEFERVTMREFNKLRSMQLGSKTLCEAHVNHAHAYARLADTNLKLALLARDGAYQAVIDREGVSHGQAGPALRELFAAMRGKPTDNVPRTLPACALNGLAAIQIEEAERNICRAQVAAARAQPTIEWHYTHIAPGVNPACQDDPNNNQDARRDIMGILAKVNTEIENVLKCISGAATGEPMHATLVDDLKGAASLAAELANDDDDDDTVDGIIDGEGGGANGGENVTADATGDDGMHAAITALAWEIWDDYLKDFEQITDRDVTFTVQEVLAMMDGVHAEWLADDVGKAWLQDLFRPALELLAEENEIMVVGDKILIIPAGAGAQ